MMTDARLGISVALLRPLAELLGRLDEDPAAFLHTVGITAEMAPNTYVAGTEVDRALSAIAVRRGDPALALTLATAAAARPLGLFGHMVWLSGTVRDAITRAAKRYQLVTQRTALSLDEDGGPIAVLRSRPVDASVPRGRILTEFPFASLALRARATTNEVFAVRAMRFAHAGEPSPAYGEVFRVAVTFGNPCDELEIATPDLDLPLASADPITVAVLESQVVHLTESARSPFLERVRRAVAAQTGEPAPDAIAKELGQSARTLRRHLEQAGTTLRAVVDDVRRERADELLARGASVKEVAFALGFSEPSAFSRAYKRWTGKAPTET